MPTLIDLVTKGQSLVDDARHSRITDYGLRCDAWTAEVENALADKPLDLARFQQAQPITTPTSGITYGTMNDWQRLRGRLAVLTEIASASKKDEVFALKPTMWGIGIDLKALWRRLRRQSA